MVKNIIFSVTVILLVVSCGQQINPEAYEATAEKPARDAYATYQAEEFSKQATSWAIEDKMDVPDFPNKSDCMYGCINPPPGCRIKGNISFDTNEKIYHLPSDEFYNQTEIDTDYGERWFCTSAEAEASGWRRAYR